MVNVMRVHYVFIDNINNIKVLRIIIIIYNYYNKFNINKILKDNTNLNWFLSFKNSILFYWNFLIKMKNSKIEINKI